MKNLSVKTVKPALLTELQKNEYVNLHQNYVSLDPQTILDYLLPRDYVLLYYQKKSQQLVATVGVQIIDIQNTSIIYFGNVVVDSSFAHEGCIAHASAKHVFHLFLTRPFKRKFCCGLASSSGALVYSLKHRPSWPNPDEQTPQEITSLMIKTIEKIGIDNYRVEKGNLIASNLTNKVNGSFHVKQKSASIGDSFFNQINPGAEKGEQVLFLNPFNLSNAIDLAVHAMHGYLIKSPKFYRTIIKYKNSRPVYSLLVLGLCLMKSRFW